MRNRTPMFQTLLLALCLLLDLVVAQPDVVQPVVAHVRGRVAVQAVVDEQLRAVLERGLVRQALRSRNGSTLAKRPATALASTVTAPIFSATSRASSTWQS